MFDIITWSHLSLPLSSLGSYYEKLIQPLFIDWIGDGFDGDTPAQVIDRLNLPDSIDEDVAEYIWGEPCLDEDLFKAIDNGEVILGGCCVSDHDPQYHCNTCHKDFGKREG